VTASTREEIQAYQLERLNETLRLAREKSRFYARRLRGTGEPRLKSVEEITLLPFTEEKDLSRGIDDFMCVPGREISRVVSLFSSGSTGRPKRICFTTDDIGLTVEYFASGMRRVTGPGGRVMICMSGGSDYGVARLLSDALETFGARPVIYGTVSNPRGAADFMAAEKPDCIVGIPAQVLALAECYGRFYGGKTLTSILLSADYAAESLKQRIRRIFGCPVFNHYGSTEMGYGGALECRPGNGLHVREKDLLFEIMDSSSGQPAPPGEEGEIVFTTLTRRGMPLMRYRTGDFSRFIPAPCDCGQTSRRIAPPVRKNENATILQEKELSLPLLDEMLFARPEILDYSAALTATNTGPARLRLTIWTRAEDDIDLGSIRYAVAEAAPETEIDIERANPAEKYPGLRGKRILMIEK
jgi:phenylacetate-coenzyme A ligase PaaK-like adenylate-forming protein